MAFKRKAYKKKRFQKKRKHIKKWGKKSYKKGATKRGNFGTCTETYDAGTFNMVTDTTSTAATLSTINLSANFPRTVNLAGNYRFYRVTKVTYDYMPEANLYAAGPSTTIPTVPRFISVMCRDGNFNGSSASAAGFVGDLEAMGGKFRPFLKPVKISYTPNLVFSLFAIDNSGGGTGGVTTPIRKKMPWLSTITEGTTSGAFTPGIQATHYGHQWAVVADGFASAQIAGSLKITVHTEFKLPLGILA